MRGKFIANYLPGPLAELRAKRPGVTTGEPRATAKFSSEDLVKQGYVGVFAPPGEPAEGWGPGENPSFLSSASATQPAT